MTSIMNFKSTAASAVGNSQNELARERLQQFQQHVCVKRISPCPPSDCITAEPKRSRTVYSPATVIANNRAMSVTPFGIRTRNIQDENKVFQGRFGTPSNCFQSYCLQPNNGAPCAGPATGLTYDPINSSNVPRPSGQDSKRTRCCPVLSSSNAFSTPPYSLNTNGQGKEAKRYRRRPITERLRRRSPNTKKMKNRNVGCLSMMKNVAVNSIKTAQSCIEKNVPQPGLNALAVYHSFLKQQEERCPNRTSAKWETTNVEQTSSLRRFKDTDTRYSNGFAPQLTSTPQKYRRYEGQTGNKESNGQIESPVTNDGKAAHFDNSENSLDDVLDALEEEARQGSSHIMLPITELAEIVKNFQKQQTEGDEILSSTVATKTSSCSNKHNDDDNNNGSKEKKRRKPEARQVKSKLPGMYPIGAPRAASSPISASRKRALAIYDDNEYPDNYDFGPSRRKRHAVSDSNGGVWRPW